MNKMITDFMQKGGATQPAIAAPVAVKLPEEVEDAPIAAPADSKN
ncbi:MAG: hypothetical protein K0R47_5557, partial [Brevibacillus sp.]|nr:hypothetical protein [Brevibacillus sp.]